jgi:hypothetical protein
MDSMMDAIKSHNPIKIQQLFENEHIVLQSIPMTSYCDDQAAGNHNSVSRCCDCQQPDHLVLKSVIVCRTHCNMTSLEYFVGQYAQCQEGD